MTTVKGSLLSCLSGSEHDSRAQFNAFFFLSCLSGSVLEPANSNYLICKEQWESTLKTPFFQALNIDAITVCYRSIQKKEQNMVLTPLNKYIIMTTQHLSRLHVR